MLERFQLRNFQRIKLIRIRFSPTVTTIVGKSRTGKSCTIRGLRWLCTNRPNTAAIQRHGTNHTIANLWIDGHRIDRERGKGGQLYRINGKPFKAISTEVPPEIDKLLNLDEINFQAQSDGPYWLFDSPGQVSKNLNAIVDLGVIDEVLSQLAARTRKTKTIVEVSQSRLKAARQTKTDLSFAVQLDTELQAVERLAEERRQKQRQIDSLALVVQEVQAAAEARENAVVALSGARRVEKAASEALELAEGVRSLEKLITQIEQTSQLTKRRQPDFAPVESAFKRAVAARDSYEALRMIVNEVAELQKWNAAVRTRLETTKKELKRKTGGRCPLCQNPM